VDPNKLNSQDADDGEYPQNGYGIDCSVFHRLEAIDTIYSGVFQHIFLLWVDAGKCGLHS
jgi:hypothetical protein